MVLQPVLLYFLKTPWKSWEEKLFVICFICMIHQNDFRLKSVIVTDLEIFNFLLIKSLSFIFFFKSFNESFFFKLDNKEEISKMMEKRVSPKGNSSY